MSKNAVKVLQWMFLYRQATELPRISIPSIDRIVMKNDESIIFNGELGSILDILQAESLIESNLGKGYAITTKGLGFLKQIQDE